METVDVIQSVFDAMDLTVTVDSIVDNGNDTFTLFSCETKHLQEGFPLTIGANSYTITAINNNVSITLSGTIVPNVTSFEAYVPHYFHGTVIKVKDDMKAPQGSENLFSRTPFVYLKEIIKDTNYRRRSGNVLDRTSSLQIFFLTQSKFKDWSTINHYEKAIAPMRNLVNMFIESLFNSTLIGDFSKEPDTTTPHVNFGVYVDSKGHTQSIFVDKFSGIELEINIPIKKEKPCDC